MIKHITVSSTDLRKDKESIVGLNLFGFFTFIFWTGGGGL